MIIHQDSQTRLAEIRQRNTDRKESSAAGGARGHFEIDFLLRHVDTLESEVKRLEDFQNTIANRMPDHFDGDWDQESLINAWLDSLNKADEEATK